MHTALNDRGRPNHVSIPRKRFKSKRGFSLVELMVTIGIIAVLAGLLVVALKKVQQSNRRAQTLATMQSFLNACQAFRLEQGFNPGLIPEHILAFNNHQVFHGVEGGPVISSTENALLHLMGGYAVRGEVSNEIWDNLTEAKGWNLYEVMTDVGGVFAFKVNTSRMGEGPVINGKPYPPYFIPKADEVRVLDDGVPGSLQQWPWGGGESVAASLALPDLADAWGNPILYMRQCKTTGPLIAGAHDLGGLVRPQFFIDSTYPYIRARHQVWDACNTNPDPTTGRIPTQGSILYSAQIFFDGQEPYNVEKGLAFLVRHPGLEGANDPAGPVPLGSPRGAVVVISAGEDGIYFSAADGPGSAKKPIGSTGCAGLDPFPYEDFLTSDPKVLDTFDDLRVFGSEL